MRIAIVGGVFGATTPAQRCRQTPETLLAAGLEGRGHMVATYSHYQRVDTALFDVVHVHHASFGAMHMAFDRSRVPLIFTSHDGVAMAGRQQRARTRASEMVFSRVDASVALSRAEAAFQMESYDLEGAEVAVIPNGIDASVFQYRRLNSAGRDGVVRLLYAGQLAPLKRVDVLLQALALLPESVHLALAFHVDDCLDDLRRLSGELGVESRTDFLGPRAPLELRDLYQSSDVFVLPSACESLPSVVSEAMLCGIPVVASDVGGVREQLHGFGVTVRPGDARELRDGIARVIHDYPRFAGCGERMSESARQRFSVDSMVDSHIALYERLLTLGRPRRHGVNRAITAAPAHAALRVLTRRGITRWTPL